MLNHNIPVPSSNYSREQSSISQEGVNFFAKKTKILEDPELDDLARWVLGKISEPHNWLNDFFALNPEAGDTFKNAKISSDLSYVARRNLLSEDLQKEADTFRFNTLINQVVKDNPLTVLSISPRWLFNMETFYLQCSARNKNIIKNYKIERLSDLCKSFLICAL